MNISKILSIFEYDVLTGAATADLRRLYYLAPSSVAFTVTLPASAVEGDAIGFSANDLVETYNVTISGNGNTIEGDATLIVDVNYAQFWLVYDGSEWKL